MLDALALAVLDLSDTVVVVTTASSPVVAGTARLLRMLKSVGFDDRRIRLVVNQYRNANDMVPPEIVAEHVDRAIDHVVPFLAPVSLAAHRGTPALFERAAGPFREAVLRLAKDLQRGDATA
jgi:MinD-like ATPase involved in chromosome partitioning or flagellar assembly